MASELIVHDGTVAMQVFGDDYAAIKNGIAQNLTDTELDYLASVSRSMGLSVLRKQIYGTKRKSKVNGQWVESVVIQVGIDGYRVIAERTGRYGGQLGPLWCGADGEWRDVWLDSDPPMAAKVAVIRTDFKEPLWAVATYTSYAAMYENRPQGLWAKMPEVMLAKCAESLALRKAFPDQMAGTYTDDEMGQADNPPAVPEPPREIHPPSTPITQSRIAPLSAPRVKATAQPNGQEQTKERVIAKMREKGMRLDDSVTRATMADLAACVEMEFQKRMMPSPLRREPDGSATPGAILNALLALPSRTVDMETGEVREEEPVLTDEQMKAEIAQGSLIGTGQ